MNQQAFEAAIAEIEQIIDTKVGRYVSDAIVAPMITGTKEQHRQGSLTALLKSS